MKETTRTELGCPGHFICANDCRFRRHTQIVGPGGAWKISTVGNFHAHDGEERTPLGADLDSFFETMVFPLTDRPNEGNEGCGCLEAADWREIDGERCATAGEAQTNHERYVEKYLAMAKERA